MLLKSTRCETKLADGLVSQRDQCWLRFNFSCAVRHVLCRAGLENRYSYLMSGRVRVVREDEVTGEQRELKAMEPGELFGLLSSIDRMPAAATCIAAGPVRAGALPRTALDLLMHSAAPIALHFQRLVAAQLARDLQDRNRSLRLLLSGNL